MATSYIFNFTDPWTTSFNVNAFSSNGPIFPLSTQLEATAVAANTSFVMYGKGHPNYGERIQENLIHLLETMSGSVEPEYPISGQQWFRRLDIVRTGGSNWFQWNVGTLSWDAFTPTLGAPVTWTHGEIFTDGAPTPAITRVINEAGHPLSPASPVTGSIVPVVWQDLASLPTDPHLQLMMYNGDEWIAQNTVRSSDVEPTGAGVGDLWFDTNTNQLKIWDGAAFIATADLYLPLAGGTMSGDIDMGVNSIIGMVDPVNPQDAATKFYVDAAVGTSVAKLDDLLDVTFGTPDPDPSTTTPFMKHDSSLVASQDNTSYTGVGNFGSFIGGDGAGGTAYAPADTITLSNGALITVGVIDGNGDVVTFVVTTPGTNAADGVALTQASTSGTGAAFQLIPGIVNIVGWKASLLILDDVSDVTASVTQVNYLSTATSDIQVQLDNKLNLGGGTLTGTLFMSNNLISDLQDPIGNQDATPKLWVENHVATEIGAIGGTDTFVTGITLNTLVGDPQEGEMTLQQLNGTLPADIVVAGFAVQGHTHNSEDIAHAPLSSSFMQQLPSTPTDVDETFFQLEEYVKRRTLPRRNVEVLVGAGTGPFIVPEYEPATNKLMVFVNGVKLIANDAAQTAALWNSQIDGSTDTDLAASTPYTFDVTVDGVGPTTVTFTTSAFVGPAFYDFVEMTADMNAALVLAGIAATFVFQDGVLELYSDDQSATGDVDLTNGSSGTNVFGTGFATVGGFSGFDGPSTTTVWGYEENGKYGSTSTDIITNAALAIGDVIESIVLGDDGLP